MSKKIIIIEDEQAEIDLLKMSISMTGEFEVIAFVDGETALEELKKNPRNADLIFLDLNLPNKSGLEVLNEIKKDQDLRQKPVVVLSSSDMKEDIDKCYDAGANSYVHKPSDVKEFRRTVADIINHWFNLSKMPS